MKVLIRKQCKIGMRVKLTRPDSGYSIGRNNPMVGTEWECSGTIDNLDASIGVLWDNGCHNGYKNFELSLADYPEGKCESIW